MENALVRKLEQFANFTADERERLNELIGDKRQRYAPRDVILPQGEAVDDIHLVLTGLAARSKTLPDGERQIMAFLVPGDLCDVEVFVLKAMDHDIVAVCETVCALIPTQKIETLLSEMSALSKALLWSTMTDSAVLRERIIDHGRRTAPERIAHLFYELLIRYRVIGATTDNSFIFPVTQEQFADATGLTTVHVNRTLKEMRDQGLIDWKSKTVTIRDPEGLKKLAQFESDYLHLDRTEAGDPEVAERAGDLI